MAKKMVLSYILLGFLAGLLMPSSVFAVPSSPWDAVVTENNPYTINPYELDAELSFDMWWDLDGFDPSYYRTCELKVYSQYWWYGSFYSYLLGTVRAYNSSTEWETRTFDIPSYLEGKTTALKFRVQEDSSWYSVPAAYLRNVGGATTSFDVTSSDISAPVPEPSTVFLIGAALLGLVGIVGRKKK